MEKIRIYFLKFLKKAKLLPYFNFHFSKKINQRTFRIPVFNGVGMDNIVLKKDWLDLLIQEFAFPQNSRTFVDVGANVGQTLLRLKSIYPSSDYIGFEPSAACVAYIQRLIKANIIKNCTIQNVGLATEVAIMQLEKDNDTDSRASIISNLRPNYFSTSETVFVLDYQRFYMDKPIEFVKIDVEGAELDVLKGMENAIQKYRPVITCEVLDSHNLDVLPCAQNRANQLCEMVRSWNYNIIHLQTDRSTIVSFKKIDTIQLVEWSFKSLSLNDYIFYPLEKETETIGKLKKIVSR